MKWLNLWIKEENFDEDIPSSNGSRSKSAPKPSKIYSPFRIIGNVSNDIPFAIGTFRSTFYIVTSVGRSFQIYDAATLHLLFVSQSQTPSRITSLTAHYHYVFAAYGNSIGIYKRGRLEHTLECTTRLPLLKY